MKSVINHFSYKAENNIILWVIFISNTWEYTFFNNKQKTAVRIWCSSPILLRIAHYVVLHEKTFILLHVMSCYAWQGKPSNRDRTQSEDPPHTVCVEAHIRPPPVVRTSCMTIGSSPPWLRVSSFVLLHHCEVTERIALRVLQLEGRNDDRGVVHGRGLGNRPGRCQACVLWTFEMVIHCDIEATSQDGSGSDRFSWEAHQFRSALLGKSSRYLLVRVLVLVDIYISNGRRRRSKTCWNSTTARL